MPLRAAKLTIQMAAFVDAAIMRAEVALETDIENMLASGVSRQAILDYLEENIKRYKQALVSDVMRPMRAAINQATVASYWDKIAGVSNYWRWEYEPTAKHCPTCVERHGMVGTRAQFEAIGTPGAGTTICQGGCRCQLYPITHEDYEAGSKKLGAA